MPELREYRRLVRPRPATCSERYEGGLGTSVGGVATADAELCALFNPPRFSGDHYMYHQVEYSKVLHSENTVHLGVLCVSQTKVSQHDI
jgi:hypothetical protein